MKKYHMPPEVWLKLCQYYCGDDYRVTTGKELDESLYKTYGIMLVPDTLHHYDITDDAGFTMFLLRWA